MFKKGQSGNPNGRPKGAKDAFSIEMFCKTLKKVERNKHEKFFEHVIKQAYVDNKVLAVVLHKLLPNLIYKEGSFEFPHIDEELEIPIKTNPKRYEAFLN